MYGGNFGSYDVNPDFTGGAIRRAVSGAGDVFKQLSNSQQKKGTITGGLRAANSDTSKARMSLPLSDVAKSGSESFGSNVKPNVQPQSSNSDFDLYSKLSDRSLKDRGAMGNQDIDLTKRKIREVDTIANNEANRAMGMSLATQFPYKKYEAESTSAREIMNNAQGAIPTFLNRATASRINPVSLSL